METTHNAKLTSAEISQIWAAYQNDSMAICVMQYFMKTAEDPAVASIIQEGLEISQGHIPILENFFNGENWPIPRGFKESDVNLDVPRLFSDSFMLNYTHQMGMLGMNAYSMAIALSTRPDLYGYFSTCMSEVMNLHQNASHLLLEKGLYIRSPYLPAPDSIDFVTNKKFLGGWFGENRPLVSLEIANLYANIQRNALGKGLMMGFAQVAGSEEVRKFLVRGKEIAEKQVEVFSTLLNKDDLPASVTWDNEVTDSTVSPFSDKLMMFHTTSLIAIGVGYYGTSMATCFRKDVTTDYTRLSAEILKYADDGAKLMIDKGWMEEPPQTADREQLAKRKD